MKMPKFSDFDSTYPGKIVLKEKLNFSKDFKKIIQWVTTISNKYPVWYD